MLVEVGVEVLGGLEVLGDVAGPGVERLLHLLPLPPGGAVREARHDRQLGRAAAGIEGVAHGEGGIPEESLQPLRLGDEGGPRRRAQGPQALLPGEPLGARARRGEAGSPGVRAFEERPARLGEPPGQRRIAPLRIGDPHRARGHHRAVGKKPQPELLADGSLEAGWQ